MTFGLFRAGKAILLAALLASSTGRAHAQADEGAPIAATPAARPFRVLAFAEADRVRLEAHAPGGARLTAAPRARIVGPDGSTLWSGTLALEGGVGIRQVEGLRPRLWEPASPVLYTLTVEARTSRGVQRSTARIGFRSFESKGGHLYLNGRRFFLRGNAINPPDRTIPKPLDESRQFAFDYLSDLKRRGINIVRFNRTSQVWLDVADEVGMMVFQGNYGTPDGGGAGRPPVMTDAELSRYYREVELGPLVNHPSVVVYVLSNEQASEDIGYLRTGYAAVDSFLTRAHRLLRPWDSTRAYIGNAGYGLGRGGDVADVHRYWGWYYNSFLSFYTLREPGLYWRNGVQPITLSENTGNYTGPDGRYNLVSASKQPDSQLNWTGHAPDREQAARALTYQAFVGKQAIEITRRLRAVNPHLHGLMPFSIPFYRWSGITRYADMGAKPILDQYAVSYQPVLLSWEHWQPHVYAGTTIRPAAHVVNDDDLGRDLAPLTLRYELVDARGQAVLTGQQALGPVAYYAAKRWPVEMRLPETLPTGDYTLRGTVTAADTVVSRNETPLWIAARTFASAPAAPARTLKLYDPAGGTARALRMLGVPYASFVQFGPLDPARDLVVIGQGAWDAAIAGRVDDLRAFVAAGGRALVLAQQPGAFDASWLPVNVRLSTQELDHPHVFPGGRPFRNGMAINPERPDHPVFEGLTRDRLFLWSDPSGWTETAPGFPGVYPVTQGFVVPEPADLARVAILADYDHGLEGIALAELFGQGERAGSVLMTGFDLAPRAGLDPAADRLLANLVRYATSEAPRHAHLLVEAPIRWGDYESERGVVAGIRNGLLVHTVPIVPDDLKARFPLNVDANGFAFAGGGGGWNSKPAITYAPEGRRIYGPYTFTTGGSYRILEANGGVGTGFLWLRVPATRTRMMTVARNQADAPLPLTIEANGHAQTVTVAPGAAQTFAMPVTPGPDGAVALRFRGDRRIVLLETRFE